MAAIAVSVCGCKIVVVVDVAVGAGIHLASRRHLVRTHQRPSRRCVIERNVCPQRGIVARRTVRSGKRRARRRMRGVIGLLPSRQVASGISAIIRLNRQVVVVVDMAVGAGVHLASRGHLVRIGKWKARGAVIESRGLPRDGSVAIRAGRNWEYVRSGRVIGVGSLLPGGQVALRVPAVRRCNL